MVEETYTLNELQKRERDGTILIIFNENIYVNSKKGFRIPCHKNKIGQINFKRPALVEIMFSKKGHFGFKVFPYTLGWINIG